MLSKMVNVYLILSIFIVFLKNRNLISKIRRSKVTDYAALTARISFPFTILFYEITMTNIVDSLINLKMQMFAKL